MMTRRRLSLQLTPLLDLLLIVMFSQYIENRSRSAEAAEELRLQKMAVQEELTRERAQLEELRKNYESQYRSLLQQHQNIGTLLNQTLDFPATALAEVLKLRNDNRPADAERLQQALTTLRSQLDQNPDALFRSGKFTCNRTANVDCRMDNSHWKLTSPPKWNLLKNCSKPQNHWKILTASSCCSSPGAMLNWAHSRKHAVL
jgi:hypothetical protein